MALAFNLIETNDNSTDASSFDTGSISPVANRLYLIFVASSHASADPSTPTLSGAGMTWTQIATFALTTKRVTVFRALSASPGSGVVTMDFAGQIQQCALWAIIEITGMKTSGTNGSDAIVQNKTGGGNSSQSDITLTFDSAWASSENRGIVSAFSGINELMTAGVGFTMRSTTSATGPVTQLGTANGRDTDNTLDIFWSTASYSRGIALEIAAELVAGVPFFTTVDAKRI